MAGSGCRFGFELLSDEQISGGEGGSISSTGAQPGGNGASTGMGGASATGGTLSSGGTGNSSGSGGTQTMGGATSGGSDCQGTLGSTMVFSFDAGVEGWALSPYDENDGTLMWTGATGNPDAGALLSETISLQYPKSEQAYGDLTGKVITARIYLESGSAVVRVFAQSAQSRWADGGGYTAVAGEWICASLDVSNPVSAHTAFDPQTIWAIGVQVVTDEPSRLSIDDVRF